MDKFKNLITKNAENIRNIYNQKEITNFINNIIENKNVNEQNILNWLHSNLKNHILRERPIKLINSLNEVIEDWAIIGVKNGTLGNVELGIDLHGEILHVIDFLRSEYVNKNLDRLAINDAIKQSIDWLEKQKSVDDDINGRSIAFESSNGYSIVELHNAQAIEYEGYKMSHCIALSYKNKILSGEKRGFSLRDKNNEPHVTILYDINKSIIEEVKGKANHFVKPEYQKHLIDFFNTIIFNQIKDYNYIKNIEYINGNFAFTDNVSKEREKQYDFKYPEFKAFAFKNKVFFSKMPTIKILTKISEKIIAKRLGKTEKSLLNKKFREIEIDEFGYRDEYAFNNLKTNTLVINNILGDINVLDNNDIKFLNIFGKKEIKIKTLNLSKIECLKISPKNKFTINTLDLSQSLNLKLLEINNCVIGNLILPITLQELKIVNTKLEKMSDVKVKKCHFHNSNINNGIIDVENIKIFRSIIDSEKFKNINMIVSDKSYRIKSNFIINKEECIFDKDQEIKNGNISKLDTEALYKFIPEVFSNIWHENKNLEDHYASDLYITRSICNEIKDIYVKDIKNLRKEANTELKFFELNQNFDLFYMCDNYISNWLKPNPKNKIAIRKEFYQYLEKEKIVGQFFLLETLRLFNPNVTSHFEEMLKEKAHPFIKVLMQKIKDNHYYLLNDDYNKVISSQTITNWESFYCETYNIIKKIKFESDLMNDFIDNTQKELFANFNKMTEDKDEVIKNLIQLNLYNKLTEDPELFKKELINTNAEQKSKIYANIFENMPKEKNIDNDMLVQNLYEKIFDLNLDEVLKRDELIMNFISYTQKDKPRERYSSAKIRKLLGKPEKRYK